MIMFLLGRQNVRVSDIVIVIMSTRQPRYKTSFFQNLLQSQRPLALLELISLESQCLSSELSEGGLDPSLSLRISLDGTLCTQTSSKQPSLTTNEKSTQTEEGICGNVSESRGLEHGCEVGEGLGTATSELHGDGLLSCSESIEHGGSVGAQAVGEVEAEGEAYDGANGRVRRHARGCRLKRCAV